MSRQGETGSAATAGTVRNAPSVDMQVLNAVSGMKEVMEIMMEAVDRNTKIVIMVGEAVANVTHATGIADHGPLDASTAARNAGKATQTEEGRRVEWHAREPEVAQGTRSAHQTRVPSDQMGAGEEKHDRNPSDFYPPQTAYRTYSKSMNPVKMSKPGDPHFFAARREWRRILQDFPVSPGLHRRLLVCAFSGTALAIFEEIASAHLDTDADDLWVLLNDRLCNGSHQRSLRVAFDMMEWDDGIESIKQCAHRLRAAAVKLPERVSEERLLD